MRRQRHAMARHVLVLAILLGGLGLVRPAEAYIGPGAGFAFLSSFLVLAVSFLLALASLVVWPVRLVAAALTARRSTRRAAVDRVVILGLDGLDPKLTQQFLAEGKLPHFQRLQQTGSFAPLATSYPSISPAAWSSFMTGVDCSYHNIFDFITRDPKTYLPVLTSAEIGRSTRRLRLGRYTIPLGSRPKVRGLRKSKPFWTILGEHDVFSSIIRVPITFPPEKFNGVLLSGMCTPDLRGTQGTFSHYSTREEVQDGTEGGVFVPLTREGRTIRTWLHGPENDRQPGGQRLRIPMTLLVDEAQGRLEVRLSGQRLSLAPRSYSPWIRVSFRAGLAKVHGICRFYLNQVQPEVDLYVTPVQIDPERPALPISHPLVYSVYLAKLMDSYGTLGLAEDTWALNEGVIDEESFLEQAYLYCREREEMLFNALERTPRGLCVCVFDTTDRIQHMFFRCLDDDHPANRGKETARYKGVIEDLYRRTDALLGRLMARLDDRTVLIVMSDHGFAPFRRGVNLNTWLLQHGYLTLKAGRSVSGEWFADVDWSQTKAFSLGLTGLFINRKGRESRGVVAEGEEFRDLKRELISKLTGLVDGETGEVAIREVVDAEQMFAGPYLDNGPDLLIGYSPGYRASWDCASGRVTEKLFEDNTRRWSGDHCIDPKLVPGVFFCNRPIDGGPPDIRDIAPTVLRLFGVEVPRYMEGRPLITEAGPAAPAGVRGNGNRAGERRDSR